MITVVLFVYGLWIMRTPDGYIWLDDVDLAIHETGHLVFGWGGERLAAFGGTLLQILMPIAFMAHFAWRRDWHAATVPLWWLGQNGWNIARYVADARAQELPLVGGGEHDWTYLLAEFGLLGSDQAIARTIRMVAFILMTVSCLVGIAVLFRQARAERTPPAAA